MKTKRLYSWLLILSLLIGSLAAFPVGVFADELGASETEAAEHQKTSENEERIVELQQDNFNDSIDDYDDGDFEEAIAINITRYPDSLSFYYGDTRTAYWDKDLEEYYLYTDSFNLNGLEFELIFTDYSYKLIFDDGYFYDEDGMPAGEYYEIHEYNAEMDAWYYADFVDGSVGKHTVKFWYEGAMAELEYEVLENPVRSMSIVKLPDKTDYSFGFVPLFDGMKIKIEYKNGSSKEVTIDSDIIDFDDFEYFGLFEIDGMQAYIDGPFDGGCYSIDLFGQEVIVDGFTYNNDIDSLYMKKNYEWKGKFEITVFKKDFSSKKYSVNNFIATDGFGGYYTGLYKTEDGMIPVSVTSWWGEEDETPSSYRILNRDFYDDGFGTFYQDSFYSDEGFEYSFYWSDNGYGNDVEITSYAGDYLGLYNSDDTFVIPGEIDGYTVTKIGYGAFEGYSNPEFIIPNTVEYIGGNAFSECVCMTSITIPESVTQIKHDAFQDCRNLESIYVSDSLYNIDGNPFYGTSWFENQPDGVVYIGKVALGIRGYYPSVINVKAGTKAIASSAFAEYDIETITISDSVEYVGTLAFWDCDNLKKIYFKGDAPEFSTDEWGDGDQFSGVTATAYYPKGNATWTEEVRQDYGGEITWVAEGSDKTDIVKFSDGKWYYTVDGKKDLTFTGFASNANGRFRIEKGVVNFKYTDVVKDEDEWRYYSGGKWQKGTTSVEKRSNGTWWYVKNGVVQFGTTGLVKRTENNTWWYVKGGQVQFNFTGFADNGGRYRVEKGQVNFKYTDVVKDGSEWRYYSGGKWQTGVTSVEKRSNGTWWYVKKGVVQFGVTDVVKRTENNTWWYVKGGQVQTKLTSVVKKSDGSWWYVKNGQVQTG
ncbi:MAG: leucine-rich repeat domain-containing protein, partial [Lachnospiraceae bacterium]|nr:leucine-rich repeat domain-containing protein [Lachnospiraceae bacterium]